MKILERTKIGLFPDRQNIRLAGMVSDSKRL